MRADIDITRNVEIVATCTECGTRRGLPENWREIMRQDGANQGWDGVLRCRKMHPPAEMALERVVHATRSALGNVIQHLVTDDGKRAACTDEPWEQQPNLPPGTTVEFCTACNNLAHRGGFAQ